MTEEELRKRVIKNDFTELVDTGKTFQNDWRVYEIVIDNYRHGLYPKHRTMTDEFFRQTAKALEFRAEMLSLRSELESRRDEHHEKMIENREKMIDRIDKLITNLDRPDRFL